MRQMSYDELRTGLANIDNLSMKDRNSLLALEVAHIFAATWAKLFVRGILTRRVFNVGCRQLIEAGDYARLDVLSTILTTVLSERTKTADCTGLFDLFIKVRKLIAHKKALLSILNF